MTRPEKTWRTQPSKRTWIQIATQEAEREGVSPVAVMAGVRHGPITRARWRAWERLKRENPSYSLAGIGRVTGFHHTTVMFGLMRLAGVSAREMKLPKRSLAYTQERAGTSNNAHLINESKNAE